MLQELLDWEGRRLDRDSAVDAQRGAGVAAPSVITLEK